MQVPLQVYLDSSDYSHMSDPSSSLYQRYQGVKRRLIQLRDVGKIEVRFSTAHVLEMAHTERRFRDAAMRRVETMLEICGPRVLLAPIIHDGHRI